MSGWVVTYSRVPSLLCEQHTLHAPVYEALTCTKLKCCRNPEQQLFLRIFPLGGDFYQFNCLGDCFLVGFYFKTPFFFHPKEGGKRRWNLRGEKTQLFKHTNLQSCKNSTNSVAEINRGISQCIRFKIICLQIHSELSVLEVYKSPFPSPTPWSWKWIQANPLNFKLRQTGVGGAHLSSVIHETAHNSGCWVHEVYARPPLIQIPSSAHKEIVFMHKTGFSNVSPINYKNRKSEFIRCHFWIYFECSLPHITKQMPH